jgi:hypothetical protein
MGYVAAAASGNPHLGKELWALFQNGNAESRAGFGAGDSGKHSRRPAACNYHITFYHYAQHTGNSEESH